MMKNKQINLGILRKIAIGLGEINSRAVYVGGAVVSIYADDPGADDVRPTLDVDITLEIVTAGQLEGIRQELADKGFMQSTEENTICRFVFEDILVDVMSTTEVGWAPSDPWFKSGFQNRIPHSLDEELEINILPVSYFLATKFSAFSNRGEDPRTSRDFEDIIYVLDNHLEIVTGIRNAPYEVYDFLKNNLLILLEEEMEESITCHLSSFSRDERYKMLINKIKEVI